MRSIITLLAFVAALGLSAQGVSGNWNEDHYVMGHHGKLKYDESVSVWQDVDLNGMGPLLRRARYHTHLEPANVWHAFPGVPDTIVTGNYTLYMDFFGLDRDYSWHIKIYYVDLDGNEVPSLETYFHGVNTRSPAGIEMLAPIPGPYTNNSSLDYSFTVARDEGPGIETYVRLRVTDMQNNAYVYNDEYWVPDAGMMVQTGTLSVSPWNTGDHCAMIWVERSDNVYYDYTDVAVDSAEIWVPCTFWDGASTDTGETCSRPRMTLSPNPTEGTLYVQLADETKSFEVLDNTGRLLMQPPSNGLSKVTLDLSSLPPGSYLIRQGSNRAERFEKL